MLTGSPPLPRVGCRIPLPLPPSLVLYRVLPPPCGCWSGGVGLVQFNFILALAKYMCLVFLSILIVFPEALMPEATNLATWF